MIERGVAGEADAVVVQDEQAAPSAGQGGDPGESGGVRHVGEDPRFGEIPIGRSGPAKNPVVNGRSPGWVAPFAASRSAVDLGAIRALSPRADRSGYAAGSVVRGWRLPGGPARAGADSASFRCRPAAVRRFTFRIRSCLVVPADLVSSLRWRYATKQFDPNRKIPADVWECSEESLILTPSSVRPAAVAVRRRGRPR